MYRIYKNNEKQLIVINGYLHGYRKTQNMCKRITYYCLVNLIYTI